MDRALVRALRSRGVDIVTALEEGMIEQPDAAHLDFAVAHGRVLYTFNVGDFYALHTAYLAEGAVHNGIILAPQQQYSVGEQMRRLLRLMAARPAEEMSNRIEFLSHWG
jgi:hypothetical protein